MIEGFRLSPQQRHLWIAQRPDSVDLAGRFWCRVEARGNHLDGMALRAAVEEIVTRHEILRTTFRRMAELTEPLQIIGEGGISCREIDLSALPDQERSARCDAFVAEVIAAPFDFDAGPLLRLGIVRLAPAHHELVLALPALCADAASLNNLLSEMAAIAAGAGGELPSPIQYADVGELFDELLTSESTRAGRDFWQSRLQAPEDVRLHNTRSTGGGFAPRSVAIPLPAGLAGRCAELADRVGIAPSAVLQVCWRILLRRIAGGKEPVLAVRFDGRSEADLAEAIGPFARFLPFSFSLDEDLPFCELAARLDAATRELAGWQDYFSWEGRTVPGLAFEHDEGADSWAAGAACLVLVDRGSCGERFDLKLSCSRRHGDLRCVLDYDESRFEPAAVERLAAQLAHLLAEAVEAPETRVRDLDILPPSARREIVEGLNTTAVEHTRPRVLHRLFEEMAAQRPEATAARFRDQEITYRELERRSNQLARTLRRAGIRPEVRVGLCLDRSLEMLIALLGVLKTGGAYVPLDPDHPDERLSYMLAETGAPLILCRHEELPRLSSLGRRLFAVDAESPVFAQEPATKLEELATPEHLAYVIFTSGSTGRPKGVMVSHAAICNRLLWMDRVFPLAPEERVLHKTPLVFDASIWEIFSPLLSGALLVLAEPGGHRDGSYLARAAMAQEINVLQLVPSMLRVFLEEPEVAEVASLRRMFAGGEALPAELRKRFHARSRARLVNLYGPTESAIDAAFLPCSPAGDPGMAAIGRPIDNVRIFLLDADGRPVPLEVEGEIHIGGAGLARGYANNPALTAERFVPDPFSGEPGARLYRTGDLAFYHPDGLIEFLGRIDHQVKIRGYRIELGEIEVALAGHPGVRDAAVVALEIRPGVPGIVAYYVPSHEVPASPRELRAYLAERLPDYMVPAVVMRLDAMPVTTSGKLDRRALPAPDPGRIGQEATHVAPRNRKEEVLAAIWSEALGVPRVGIHDNFFELGGESILSIQVVARARQAGLRLTPRLLFQHQTIEQLAAVAVEIDNRGEMAAVTGPVPLTPIQRLFFERELPEPHHFNQALLLEVRRALAPPLLEQALGALAEHHDALRLRFAFREGSWQQANTEIKPMRPLLRIDLAAAPAERRAAALEAAAAQVQGAFDLEEGPLLRAALFTGGAGWPDRLLLVAHHLVVDGVSWRILLEDLQIAYESLERGETPQLPPRTSSFKQWAEQLVAFARSPEAVAELDVWLDAARGEVRPLPVDLPGSLPTESTAASVIVSLEAEETQALLREVPAAYRTQINDVLLAALAAALARWTGSGLLLVDLEGHGREEISDLDLSRTVGWFTSVYPVLLDVRAADGPGTLLKGVKEQLRRVPRNGVGFGLLRYLGAPEIAAALAALPRAEVTFNYLGQLDTALPRTSPFMPARESAGPSASPRTQRDHLLEVVGEVAGGRLRLEWIYGERVHFRSTIERLAGLFLAELRGLITHCLSPEAGGRTPSDFPLAGLTQAQIDRIVGKGEQVEDLYPLTPLQQGLLFHSLERPDEGVYFFQFVCRIRGELDVALFERVWQEVVDRHTILRTGFLTDDLEQPLQVVCRQVRLKWLHLDWRGLPEAERKARLENLLEEDRRVDLSFATPPLMRWGLVREEERLWTFLWSNHHLILDGWSEALVSSEVVARYSAAVHGEDVVWGEVPPFRTYIEWLASQNLAGAEDYWRRTLAGFTEPTPLDRGERIDPSKPLNSATHGLVNVRLPLDLMTDLRSFARRHQLTLSTIVQAAWALLLARYSDHRDVVYGLVVAGRPPGLDGVESLVGVFINTLPARIEVSEDERIVSWLARLQDQLSEMRHYESTPLVTIQGWSEVPRTRPLFESILVFENYPAGRAERERDLRLEIEEASSVIRDSYPISISLGPETEMGVELRYEHGRFDAAAAKHRLAHLQRLLEVFVNEGERRLGEASLLSTAEVRQLLDVARGPAGPVAFRAAHELFAEQARQAPERMAIRLGEETLTYGDLDAWAGRLAHRLRRLGVEPETRVAIFLERSFEMVVALLAVLKAGGAYIPLDPTYPAERLSLLLADADCSLVLTEERLAPRLESVRRPIVLVDPVAEVGDAIASASSRADSGGLAYVIYTSGSTGSPKGVMVTHGGLWSYLSWCLQTYPSGEGLGAPVHSSFGFDLTITSLFVPLVAGGWIDLVPESAGPGGLGATLRQSCGFGLLKITPAHLDLLSFELSTEVARATRSLVVGGEQLHAEALQRWRELAPGVIVFNEYGPTEAVVGCCVYQAPVTELATGPVPIGRPIDGARLYVVDRRLRLVPSGMVGELLIGGTGVARGYLGQGGWTAEKFLPDPFGDEPGARLYRTGDLVRLGPGGHLEYIGRLDDQIKLRGFRIEPGEIEASLVQHPRVREAAVVVREDSLEERRLVAFLVSAESGEDAESLVQEVLNSLRQKLPAHMIPTSVSTLQALPLTAHGKVDRRALAVLDETAWQTSERVAPRSPLEREVAAIWQEVLGLGEIGIFESFFDLGGHSLRVMQVLARLRLRFGVDLPIARFVENPTVAAIAVMVATLSAREAGEDEIDRILSELEQLPDDMVRFELETEKT